MTNIWCSPVRVEEKFGGVDPGWEVLNPAFSATPTDSGPFNEWLRRPALRTGLK